jgi:CBS domain-containing protein
MATEGVPVTQLMTPDVITVTPDTTVTDAVEILLEESMGSLVVVDDDQVVGVVTSTDLLEAVGGDTQGEETVRGYMTDQVITAGSTDSVQVAAANMITNDIQHLPVADTDGGVVGMVSTTDVTAFTVSQIRTGE